MLVGIWALTGHGFFWPFFPIAGWGIGLGCHAMVACSLPQEKHRDLQMATGPHEAPSPLRPLATTRLASAPAWHRPPDVPYPGSHWASSPDTAQPGPSTAHVAVLFADMVDSTALNERLGDTSWNALRTRCLHIMRDCVASHQGTEVSCQGDGLFARFDLSAGAVAAAVAMQKRIGAEPASSPPSPQLRVASTPDLYRGRRRPHWQHGQPGCPPDRRCRARRDPRHRVGGRPGR